MSLHGKSDLNSIDLSGEITKEPFYSNTGTAVLSVNLKVEDVRNDGQVFPSYFVLKFWRDDADYYRSLLHQGEYVTALRMKAGVNKREYQGETYFDVTATFDKFVSKIIVGGSDAGLVSRPMDMENGLPLDENERPTMPKLASPKPSVMKPATKPVLAKPAAKPVAPVAAAPAPTGGARPTWAPKSVAKPAAPAVAAPEATSDEYDEDLPF